VKGLPIQDFEIYDNGKLQKITDDLHDSPYSIVLAVQKSVAMEGMLPLVKDLAYPLMDLIVGADGEMALVSFDHHVQVVEGFTRSSDKVQQAMSRLTPGSYSHAAIDAVIESIHMLSNRPSAMRRVVLVIGEKWDQGSEGSVSTLLSEAQRSHVSIYSLVVPALAAEATSTPRPQPPPPIPTTAYPTRGGSALTPTVIAQNYYNGNWVPLIENGFQSTKDAFGDNPIEAFARATGGEEYSFKNKRTLDDAMRKLNEDLRSQYLFTYTPNNVNEVGFHSIRVVVKHPRLEVRAPEGYWIAGKD
jgi:VWFA-related protein